jgi:hypothetical protein
VTDSTKNRPPIRNPILPGFHPDPSIPRVGDDYYIATSTFEWFPGVRIHHSRDPRHWRPLGHALTRVSQLDLRGNPRSGGVWAPCLSHAKGPFHLIYTDSLRGIVLAISLVPGAVLVASGLAMLFYELDEKKMVQIASDLAERRDRDAEETAGVSVPPDP